MQRDGEAVVVQLPEAAKDQFRLRARVDENDSGAVLANGAVDLLQRIERHMAGPGHRPRRAGDGDLGRDAAPADDDLHIPLAPGGRREPGGQIVGIGHRGGERTPPRGRRERGEPRQRERQLVAALVVGERVQLIDDHRAQVGEQRRRVRPGEHQRQRLGRRHQHVRRRAALALALALRRVAGPRLDGDRQAHLGQRRLQIAVDIHRERLQRRDIERVQSGTGRYVASSARLGRKPASVLPPPVGATSRAERPAAAARNIAR